MNDSANPNPSIASPNLKTFIKLSDPPATGPAITRTPTFDLAYRFVTETNLNIFLTGKAGTGKTTFLKFLRANSSKKMVVAAPTGVAAINAGGVTLHSLFHLPFTPFIPATFNRQKSLREENALPENSLRGHDNEATTTHSLLSKIRYHREKLNLLRNLELLIIDEASMVASHTVDAIDTILKSVRRRHNQPFGGVQVLFIGDLHQLQPVVRREEWELLKDYYSSIFFFDSIILRENVPVMIELKEIFRQKDNSFISILNEIRHNNLTAENFELLNSRMKSGFFPQENEGYVTLTTHNAQADAINDRKLTQLKTKPHFFKAKITDDFPEHIFPAENELVLKEGAQVMFIKNDAEKRYFNGKTGVISFLSDNFIRVKCKGDSEEITVKKEEWENVSYSVHPETREIKEHVLGVFEQYPLRLAWAITIHKSQGLTFEKVIIDAENAFANGQVYVALSRCTSLNGLVLTSPVNRNFLGAHQNLKQWQEKNQDDKNLGQKLILSRQKFALKELQEVFNWKNWYYELKELNALLYENKQELPPACQLWLKEITEHQKALEEVARKFNDRILHLYHQDTMVEENLALQQRIKDAANYFYDELNKWEKKFRNHPITASTKKISTPIDSLLNDISLTVHDILQKINFCKQGFLLAEFLEKGKKILVMAEKIKSVYNGKRAEKTDISEISNPVLFKKMAELRKHLGDKSNIPLFQIYSNSAIKNVCEFLPANKKSLLKVKGFGEAKVSQYGDRIVELVREFCEQNNLEPQEIIKGKFERKSEAGSPNTLVETIKLFNEGKKIDQIAAERNFAVSTIEGHLAGAIRIGAINIKDLIPIEEVKIIAALFPNQINGPILLAEIKSKAPENVTYGKLKMVLAWLQKQQKNS